jgi:hypothetical protein
MSKTKFPYVRDKKFLPGSYVLGYHISLLKNGIRCVHCGKGVSPRKNHREVPDDFLDTRYTFKNNSNMYAIHLNCKLPYIYSLQEAVI